MNYGQNTIARDPGKSPTLWDETIDRWLDEYPAAHREELKRRLQSPERVSALFELTLHALLLRHGARVEVHPSDASSNPKRPDFLASFPNEQTAVFEAVTVNESENGAAWTQLCNHINSFPSDFHINIVRHPTPLGSPPPPRKVKSFLKRELGKLDANTARRQLEGGTWHSPECVFIDGEKRIEFHFYPKKKAYRGTTENIAGLGGFRWLEAAQAIERAVRDKASRYGGIQYPYVVVVGVNAHSPWDYASEHGEEVLFGHPSGGLGGVFVPSDGGLRHTQISGAAIATIDWRLSSVRMVLYENPHAQRPVGAVPWRLDRMEVDGSNRVLQEGKSVGEVLGLPEGWPMSHG